MSKWRTWKDIAEFERYKYLEGKQESQRVSHVNVQGVVKVSDTRCVFRMISSCTGSKKEKEIT